MDGRDIVMALAKQTVSIIHRQGLHARPAALFVQAAKTFDCKVTVKKGRKIVDGKSIMGLLTLAAHQGARIAIIAEGPEAAKALTRLVEIVTEPLPDLDAHPKT